MSKRRRKIVTATDFLNAATLLALVPVALLLPTGLWSGACRALARATSTMRMSRLWHTANTLASIQAPSGAESDVAEGYRRCLEMMFEGRLHIVDQNLFRRQSIKVQVTGREHLDAALGNGQGAILWNVPTAFSDLMTKIGLAEAGFEISQLSRPEHGFSDSRLGIAILNRLRTRVEDRYLRDRVKIDDGIEKRAMLSMKRIIDGNGIVVITAGSQTKDPQSLSIAYGTIPMATGPIRLARMSGAALLPGFSAKVGESTYELRIEAPINSGAGDEATTLQRFGMFLEANIERYPYQCRGLDQFERGV